MSRHLLSVLALSSLAALAVAGEPALPPALGAGHSLSLAGQLAFDEPGDGSLWVLGGDRYKARFSPAGATFYPFLGARAAQSESLRLELQSVRLGGAERAAPSVAPERVGETVLFERGPLVELYELGPQSMEQMFVVDALEGPGPLELRIAAHTELRALATAEGLFFEGPSGGASYSRAFAFDARGAEVPIETRYEAGTILLRIAPEDLRGIALPLTIDPIVASFEVTSVDLEHLGASDVAYDATTDRFVVVYERKFSATDGDVFSVLYTSDGQQLPGSLVAVDITASCWYGPQVANNGGASQFLTVALQSETCSVFAVVVGRTREAESNFQSAPILIDGPGGMRDRVDVGGNPSSGPGTYYCVVWDRREKGADNIWYQLVRPIGTLLFPAAQGLEVSWGSDHEPSISKSCGREPAASQAWNVVWQRSPFTTSYDIRGAQIRWDGAIQTPTFELCVSEHDERRPKASSPLEGGTGPRPWLATFERHGGADSDVLVAVLAGGQTLVAPTDLSLLEGGSHAAQNQSKPVADSDGLSFTVAYREHFHADLANRNVHLSTLRLAAGGLVVTEAHRAASLSFSDQDLPALSAMHGPAGWSPQVQGRHLVTWSERRFLPGTWAIEGALYEPAGAGEPGVALCFGSGAGPLCPCGNAAPADAGCANSSGRGARLLGLGTNRVAADDLVLVAEQLVPGSVGMLFQGEQSIAGGQGVPFGAGLRCCGQGLVRLQVWNADALGRAQSTVPIANSGAVSAGESRCYQVIYRDAIGSACGQGFNLSSAYEVLWAQ